MTENQDSDKKSVKHIYRDFQALTEWRKEKFCNIVMKAIDSLPPMFKERLENVDVVIEDWPTPAQLARSNIRSRFGLLGLYEGVPRTRRGQGYGMVLPDKITIFRKPIEARCHSWANVRDEVGKVVRHEVAHHFGIGDEQLREIENQK
jgi:predicted Zn-dependent protease with MMP-like domain